MNLDGGLRSWRGDHFKALDAEGRGADGRVPHGLAHRLTFRSTGETLAGLASPIDPMHLSHAEHKVLTYRVVRNEVA